MTFKEFTEAGGLIQYDVTAINSYEIVISEDDTTEILRNGSYVYRRIEVSEDDFYRIDVCIYDDIAVFEYSDMDDVAAFIEAGCPMDRAKEFKAYSMNESLANLPKWGDE